MLITCIFSFPKIFFTLPGTKFITLVTFKMSSANVFNLDKCICFSCDEG